MRIHMQLVRGALATLVVMGGAGCVTMDVRTEHDPRASFEGWETFAWMPDRPAIEADGRPWVGRMVRQAVEAELARQGYRLDSSAPDLWINYYVASGADLDIMTTFSVYGRPDRFGPDVRHTSEETVFVSGTLVLDVLQPGTRALLWRGVAEQAVREGPEAADKAISEATRRLLASFPPDP
jgi:hypothetical protein